MSLIAVEPLPRRAGKTDVLAFLAQHGGIDGRRIGKIELHGLRAVVEVPDGWESRLAKALDGQLFGERRVRAFVSKSSAGADSVEKDHFQRLSRLLEIESRAQAEQLAAQAGRLSGDQAEQSGNALVDLVVSDMEVGLGGRCLLELAKRKRADLPWSRLGVGSPVVLSPVASKVRVSFRAVTCERRDQGLWIALDGMPEELDEHDLWRLDLASDEVAVQRQRVALEQARQAAGDRFAILRDVLLGRRSP